MFVDKQNDAKALINKAAGEIKQYKNRFFVRE
jgi:hypothetical protein